MNGFLQGRSNSFAGFNSTDAFRSKVQRFTKTHVTACEKEHGDNAYFR